MAELDAVWSSTLSAADMQAYDRFIADARGAHYSQTRDWAKIATAGKSLSPRYFLARRNGHVVGAALALQPTILGGLALPLARIDRGPVCNDPDDFADVLKSLLAQTRRHGILRLAVMPYWGGETKARIEHILNDNRFSDVQAFEGSHVRSLRLDLSSLLADNLFEGSVLAKIRQNVRRAERAGAVSRRGEKRDLQSFREMHEQRLRHDAKRLPPPAWYEALADYFLSVERRGAMFVCEYQGEVVAAVFLTRHGPLATYVMGASSGRDLPFPKMIQPMAHAISWAREEGIAVLDLGGIPMAGDTDPKRASIAEFKRSFSRAEISFVHEHARWL